MNTIHYGGTGTDNLTGGDGADNLDGGVDNDTLSGFAYADGYWHLVWSPRGQRLTSCKNSGLHGDWLVSPERFRELCDAWPRTEDAAQDETETPLP